MSAEEAIAGLARDIPRGGWSLEQRTDFLNAVTAILRFCVPVSPETTASPPIAPVDDYWRAVSLNVMPPPGEAG